MRGLEPKNSMRTASGDDLRTILASRRGFVFIFFALGLVLLLGLAGLAIDTARGYVVKAQVAKAVDAAALAGAKNVRAGAAGAKALAQAIAGANGLEPDATESLVITVKDPNVDGETEILVEGERTIPTTFMKVLGIGQMKVRAQAEATVPPIDLVIVMDQSGSLVAAGAWDELQAAAKRFVAKFGDDVDQVGIVQFSTMAAVAFPLQKPFITAAQNRIDAMNPSGDTNSEEALAFGLKEMTGAAVRPKSMKVLVFFTDGRPTALRNEDGTDMGGQDGILTIAPKASDGDFVRGWYRGPEQAPTSINPDAPWQEAIRCNWTGYPVCDTGDHVWTQAEIRTAARDEALANAEQIRQQGVLVYSIGFGDKKADPETRPDEKFLGDIANADGTGKGTQGSYFFVDDPKELDGVFQNIAADVLARLSQ